MKTRLLAFSAALIALSFFSSCVAPYYGRPYHHHHSGYYRSYRGTGSVGGYRGGGAGGGFGGSFGGFAR